MRNLRISFFAMLAIFASMAAHANHYADFYVIPAASHTPGLNNTNWMSDLAIQNFQSTPLTVQIVVIESGFDMDNVFPLTTEDGSGSVTVPPNGNVMLKDLLNGHRGMPATNGALLVGADRPFAITSRTYSMSPTGDTVGQTVPGAANFLDNTLSPINPATAVAYVPGLVQNANFRTNLGFVAANGSGSGGPMALVVTIRNAEGATVGTRSFSIPAGSVMHMQFSSRSMTNSNYDAGGAEFRITSGTGSVVPFASVIDNRTADAVFVLGTFPQNAPPMMFGKDAMPSLFRSIFDRMSLNR
jgi:hypothetical protein